MTAGSGPPPLPPSRPTTARRALFVLALCTAVLLPSLLALELWLRHRLAHPVMLRTGAGAAVDPYWHLRYVARHHRNPPGIQMLVRNHQLSRRDILIETSSLGLRDHEFSSPKPADETRILVLGDSITGGAYLQRDELYVERAEQALSRELPGRRIEVINAGLADVGLAEELEILRDPGLKLEPDIVVLAFYLNDSRPPWGFAGELGETTWLRRHSLIWDGLHRRLAERRWVAARGEERFAWYEDVARLRWKRDPAALRELAQRARFDWGAAWQEESWPEVERQLDVLAALGREHGFAVAVLAFPVRFQVMAEFLEDAPQQRLAALAAGRGFAFIDLLATFRAHRGEDLLFDQCHPTIRGNDLAGDALAARLLALLRR